MEKPDVAFIGYPPIEPAWVLTRWLSRQGIPTVLDIKDAWPDVLLRAFPANLQPLAKVALAPYFAMMRSTFRRSTALASVAPPFLEWALAIAKRERNEIDFIAPLTAPRVKHTQREIEEAEVWWDSQNILNNKLFRLYFVGTLNSAFDFDPVIEAAKEYPEIDFVIAGDGPQYKELHNKSMSLSNFHLVGWINSVQAKVLSTRSDIAIAPLRDLDEFEKTIPNKFYDALVYGKPILTCIKGFAADLVTSKEVGLLYERDGEGSLKDVLKLIALHPEMIQKMSTNATLLYENEYSFDMVYSAITENLERASRA
jgi:glycosyltransferase involved in cell wall biosynthesis